MARSPRMRTRLFVKPVSWRLMILVRHRLHTHWLPIVVALFYCRCGLVTFVELVGSSPLVSLFIGISFDGKFLATCGDTSNEVALWEVPEGGIGKYEHVVNWTPHGQEPLNSIHFLGSAQNRDMACFLLQCGPPTLIMQ